MTRFLVLPILLFCISSCYAKFSWGPCPTHPTVSEFNIFDYMGRWYEIESYGNPFEKMSNVCPEANYTLDCGQGAVIIQNKDVSKTGKPTVFNAVGNLVSGSKLKVRADIIFGVKATVPYWVLDTDYDNYAIVWSCYDLKLFHQDAAWIMTRERKSPLSESNDKLVTAALKKVGLVRSQFQVRNQTSCTN